MATISSTKIANLALSHVGTKSTIESLNEDSAEAKECKLWYDFAREETLKAHNWSFARKRFTLALHGDDAPDEWAYRYQYPADALAIHHLVNPAGAAADPVPFAVEMNNDGMTKTILTDLESACAVYTFNQQVTAFFTPYFIKLLARLLAHYVAFALTGKMSLANKQFTIYETLLPKAPAHDANEGQKAPPRDVDWIRARS